MNFPTPSRQNRARQGWGSLGIWLRQAGGRYEAARRMRAGVTAGGELGRGTSPPIALLGFSRGRLFRRDKGGTTSDQGGKVNGII